MKLERIVMSNFRCFENAELDLSADIVAIYGRNGTGKTTIFDAIELALLGTIGRYEGAGNPPDYIPHFDSKGPVTLRLSFHNGTEDWLEVTRDRESNSPLVVSSGSGKRNHRDFLYGSLVNDDYSPPRREVESIRDLFRSSLLLSQDSIRYFIEGGPVKRAQVLSYIAGSAYLQRCLEKIAAVGKEAELLEAEEQLKLTTLEAEAAQVKRQVLEEDASITAVKSKLGRRTVTYTAIKTTLKAARISFEMQQPKTPEQSEVLAKGIATRCDARLTELEERIRALGSLEVEVRQLPNALKQQHELSGMLERARMQLPVLLKEQNRADELLDSTKRRLMEVTANTSNLRRRFSAIQELRDLRHHHAGFIKQKRDLDKDLENLRAKLSHKTAAFEQLRRTQQETALRVSRNQVTLEEATKRLAKLEQLQRGLGDYIASKERARHLEAVIYEINRKRGTCEKRITTLLQEFGALQSRVAELNRAVSSSRSSVQEETELVTRLRQYARGNICPCCGQVYPSTEGLQQAISARLHNVPTSLQTLLRQSQEASDKLASTNADIASAREELENLNETLETSKSTQQQASSVIQRIESEARALSITLSKEVLDNLIAAQKETVANSELGLLNTEKARSIGSTELNDVSEAMRGFDSLISELSTRSLELAERIRMGEARMLELGLSQNKDMPLEELSREAKVVLVQISEFESRKHSLEQKRSQTEQQIQYSHTQYQKLENNMTGWDRQLKAVAADAEALRMKCGRLGIKEISLAEVQRVKETLAKDTALVVGAKRLAEQYAWSSRLEALKRERSQLQPKLNDMERRKKAIQGNIDTLSQAKRQTERWEQLIAQSVHRSVESTIASHEEDIGRLFKAMIPSRYLFDRITMRRGEDGVELGLRYRDQQIDCGEPRFFLSNAQSNVLALSIFLALAGKQNWSRLQVLLLDDPVQHLDDLDAVALLDNLRSIAIGGLGRKSQVIISTCDQNLYLLMIRKFSLLEKEGLRFTGISLLNSGQAGADICYDVGGPK